MDREGLEVQGGAIALVALEGEMGRVAIHDRAHAVAHDIGDRLLGVPFHVGLDQESCALVVAALAKSFMRF